MSIAMLLTFIDICVSIAMLLTLYNEETNNSIVIEGGIYYSTCIRFMTDLFLSIINLM